jgi:hypothetical protein
VFIEVDKPNLMSVESFFPFKQGFSFKFFYETAAGIGFGTKAFNRIFQLNRLWHRVD